LQAALTDRYALSVSNSPTVTLRPPSVADADLLFLLAADLDTWEERSPFTPAPLNRLTFDTRLAQTDAGSSEKNVRFVIEMDGVAVGTVSLFKFDELSLVAEARGMGVGTTAISRMVQFAFVRCNLRRLHLQVLSSNLGAIRAYEKAGFVIEGHQRQHAWVRGGYEDILLMGLLRSEWKQLPVR
jgi:RimJ/RimL family protein N-acetyltransferase